MILLHFKPAPRAV